MLLRLQIFKIHLKREIEITFNFLKQTNLKIKVHYLI